MLGNTKKGPRDRKEALHCAYSSIHNTMVWILDINMRVVCALMRLAIRHRYILYTHRLLSQSSWSLYQGKSNHKCWKRVMTIWQEDTVTDSHLQCCHVPPCLQRSWLMFQSGPDAGVVKIHPPTTHRFTCWPSNQIQPCRGPHLGPALSALESSDNPLSLVSLHNWMKRRNRSVTLECLCDLYFLLNICVQSAAGEKGTPALVLIALRLDSQPEQRGEVETGRRRPETCAPVC